MAYLHISRIVLGALLFDILVAWYGGTASEMNNEKKQD
jgi:hypothetical protein